MMPASGIDGQREGWRFVQLVYEGPPLDNVGWAVAEMSIAA